MNEIKTIENKILGEKYYKIKHKSGLDIYVYPKNLSSSYALFGTFYGSEDNSFRIDGEKEFTTVPDGIAHFLEHKLFENEDGEDTTAKFARVGAYDNAFTSNMHTAYLFSATDKFYESLEILLKSVCSPYFTEKNVAKEQGIIAQEIKMYEDDPWDSLDKGLLGGMYHNHAVKIDTCGTVESISHITPELLYKCYNTFYNLSNMALIVCGQVEVEKTLEVADRILKESKPIIIERADFNEPAAVKNEFVTLKKQVAKPIFAIGVKDIDISSDPTVRNQKNAVLTVMCEALFGRSSSFSSSLYEQGLISTHLGINYDHNSSFSYLAVSAESDRPKDIYNKFRSYIEKVKADGIPDTAVNRCKKVVYSRYVRGFDSTEEIGNTFFIDFCFEGSEFLNWGETVSFVTAADVNKLLRSLFTSDKYCLAVVEPLQQ